MSQFIYSFMEPILAKTLEDQNLNQIEIGWFFMILPAAYIPSSIALDFLPKRWDKRVVIMFGVLLCSISLIFVGPSAMLNVSPSSELRVMIFGQGVLGLFIPIGLILALPTMVEQAIRKFPGQELHVNNMSAGIFNTMNGVGEVIGPMYGAAAYESMGFRSTSDTICLICLAYVIIFFTFGLEPIEVEPESLFNQDVNSKKIINKEKKRCRSSCDLSDEKTFKSESLLSSNEDLKLMMNSKNTTGATESTHDTSSNSFRSDSTLRYRRKRLEDYVSLKSDKGKPSRNKGLD